MIPAIAAGAQVLGGLLSGRKAAKAAAAQAEELRRAGQQAFETSRFRPVGVTTAFGTSNFTIDPATGALVGADYEASPEIAAIQDRLFSQLGGQGFGLSEQALQQAQGLFGLGQQFLPTSPEYSASPEAMAYAEQLRGLAGQVLPAAYDPTAAAQQYVEQQRAILQPERERTLSGIRQNLFNTGRGGLAVAQGGDLAATNPEMAAYYNALAQQERQLAAEGSNIGRQRLMEDIRLGTGLSSDALAAQQRAEEIARQRVLSNIEVGTGLFGRGIDMASAGYRPLSTQFDILRALESSAQQPLELGMKLGETSSGINARAAALRLNPQAAAAEAQRTSSSWSPWGAALSGAGRALGSMSFPSASTPPLTVDPQGMGLGWGNFDTATLPSGWRN